ncbi:tetratricopeptide repeat protein [Polyangium jinanense]|uniref:Tetratricopeptide repeat protein n=1 Tax=Polyangium jinanense TaxID=2829994 RepID=A0A9X4AW19_9BACT|nr:tetratricopeptide repeat protein [Polyangium jinanense]MDC3959426.1 tetratricopeptide repeat protein [Polyangium jinanense]MDC3984860.1 tetratricopeptide repeat protein [Polyangium jinanense]
MKRFSILVATAALTAAVGCGGGGGGTGGKPAVDPKTGAAIVDSKGNAVSVAAANKYKDGLEAFSKHDKARDWTEATCQQAAEIFLDAADEQSGKTLVEAIYNAGVSYQRCKQDAKAKEYFKKALDADPKFHRARVQLAIYSFAESQEKAIDPAINELYQAAVVDARFQNVEGLVQLGMLHMKRNNTQADKDGRTDLQNAKRYAQSALAVDDGYLPAFNLLALIYMESAKVKAGRSSKKGVATNVSKEKKIDTQALDLAALVCSQAIRKNPNYAPIHNTAGMIQVELSNLNGAVSAFNTARKLDPTFYEAQMNFAAVNLSFRGFAQAEEAYRAALKMRPNDYDAHLGLALALRGQIDDTNFDKMVAAAAAELAEAKKISPERAETYYNDAILTQEYKAKSGGKDAEPMLLAAKQLFGEFIAKAGSAPEYADAVKRSKERMEEIQQIIDFNKQTEAERKASEAEAKNRAAEAEAKGTEEGGEAKPPEGGAPPQQ